ncbi:CPBP family intramembrane metalloprotease [candidate division KSB1 bacterium]|nr:CPBP family intramembrane metalloprotease [candidate division KSB1 bacterium]
MILPKTSRIWILTIAGVFFIASDILVNFYHPPALLWVMIGISFGSILVSRRYLPEIFLLSRYSFVVNFILLFLRFPLLETWPMFLLMRLIGLTLLALGFRDLKRSSGVRSGTTKPVLWAGSAFVVVVSTAALALWFEYFSDKILLQQWTNQLPTGNLALIILAGFGFAIVNAIIEEFIWRGALWRSLAPIFSPVAIIILQALSFGAIHFEGIPSGVPGVVLAFIYGLMLGIIRHKSNGLLLPVIAHFFADLCIYGYLVFWLA